MHQTRAVVVERPVAYANALAYQEQCVAARMEDRMPDTVIKGLLNEIFF